MAHKLSYVNIDAPAFGRRSDARLSVTLQTSAGSSKSEAIPHFAELFIMVWGGASLVTLNVILMGSQLSFFQVCACKSGSDSAPVRIHVA